MSEFLTGHDGVRLRVQEFGRGRPVVLCHGYLLDRSVFEPLARALAAAGRRVITFDQRAHGQSEGGEQAFGPDAVARDYLTVIEQCDVQNGTLLGHSMGAFYALQFCLKHAQTAQARLSRLVLLSPNAGAIARGSLPNLLQIPLLATGVMERVWAKERMGNAVVRQLFGPDSDPKQVDATRALILRQDVPRTLPMLRAMTTENHYARARDITLETRILCGRYDRTCPEWHSRRLAADIPRARVRWLERAGHMLPLEAHEAAFDAITRVEW